MTYGGDRAEVPLRRRHRHLWRRWPAPWMSQHGINAACRPSFRQSGRIDSDSQCRSGSDRGCFRQEWLVERIRRSGAPEGKWDDGRLEFDVAQAKKLVGLYQFLIDNLFRSTYSPAGTGIQMRLGSVWIGSKRRASSRLSHTSTWKFADVARWRPPGAAESWLSGWWRRGGTLRKKSGIWIWIFLKTWDWIVNLKFRTWFEMSHVESVGKFCNLISNCFQILF